jgi:hypothetical protein
MANTFWVRKNTRNPYKIGRIFPLRRFSMKVVAPLGTRRKWPRQGRGRRREEGI